MSRPRPARRRDQGAPLAVLAAAVVLPAVVLGGVWRLAGAKVGGGGAAVSIPATTLAGATPAANPPLATPLMSFRRLSGLIARDLDGGKFAEQVAGFAATLDETSCLVVDVDGVEVGTHNPDSQVIPASNQKLLTGAAALQVLGADFSFTTDVRAVGLRNGVVSGDLYLVGGGDPLLRTPDWDGSIIGYPVPDDATDINVLAQQIAAAGVTQIKGSVIGDASRYDDVAFFEEWGEDVRVSEAGPMAALMVNDSRYGGTEAWQVADNPATGAASELTRMLEANGVTVAGEPGAGQAPADAASVTTIQSAPLPAVLEEMLQTSDNNTAELLVKELGYATSGRGSTAAGIEAMTAALGELGVDTTSLVIADGSGLSVRNRVTCRAMTSLLRRHTYDDELMAGLPVAGESGTLVDNFVGTPMEKRLRGKTGSLSNPPYNDEGPSTKSLSGYVPVDGGGTIQFSLILNSPTVNYAEIVNNEPIWTAFATVVGSYPSGPPVGDLGPVGASGRSG